MIKTTDEAFDETIVDQTETGQSETISTTKPEAQKPKVFFHRHPNILDKRHSGINILFCFLNFPQQKPKKVIEKDTKAAEFLGFKLKKAETVKRQVEQDEMESVDLKHHEFEMQPTEEQVFVVLEFYSFFLVIIISKI